MSSLLERDVSLAATAELRNAAAPVLRDLLDYGLAAFERCAATAEGLDTPIGVLFPSLHAMEMLDGAEILLAGAAAVPATLSLRSAFEALLSADWVAREDSERRGAAYVVSDVRRRIARMERYDPQTERGKQLRAVLAKDEIGKILVLPHDPDAASERADLASVLEEPHLKAASVEYERVRALMNKTPEFYALWDGPRDLEQLARRLGRSAYYEILYRLWSGTAHVNDLPRQLGHVEGAPAVARLRSGAGLREAYAHAINIGLEVTQVVLKKYRSDEMPSFWSWYRKKISPVYTRLTPRPPQGS